MLRHLENSRATPPEALSPLSPSNRRLSVVRKPVPMLVPAPILLRGPVHLVRRGLEPLFHGRLGIGYADRELPLAFTAHDASLA